MIWRSYDGINWVKISDNLPFKSRKWFSTAVFDNKMWITGGASYTLIGDDVKINTYYNTDAWYSSDGVNWNIATNYTGFSGRILHKTISFDNRLWLIGGFNGTGDETDTWVTSNGVTWNKLTSYNTFGGRDGHACEVFNSKLWVIGGYKDITQTNDVWSIY